MSQSKHKTQVSKVKINKRLLKWLDSFEKVSAVVDRSDLLQLLEEGGGICRIENFLPHFVAEGILEILEQFSEADWNVTAADDDYTHNNISHAFLSTKSQVLEAIFRVFTLLMPESLFTFSAAKYCRQGHIKPHDDRAHTQVRMEDGSIQLCSRSIAVIYYLTKDWSAADGGLLIDHEAPGGPQTLAPKFNSVISFTIPRWHEVTPVVGNRPRYSVFGWFLEPGELYELQLNPQMPMELQQQQQPQQQLPALLSPQQPAQQKHRKQKERKQGAAAGDRSTQAVQEEVAPLDGQKRSKAKRQKQGLIQQGLLLQLADAQHTGPQVAAAAETEQSPGLALKGARSHMKHRQPQPKLPGTSKKVQKHKAVRPRKPL